MPVRILLQLAIVAVPFAMFGVYLLLTTAAEEDGRRKWPIAMLFGIGAVLSAGFWIYKVSFGEVKSRDLCIEQPRYENGKIIPARQYPCERDTNFGQPLSEDPGSEASGVEYEEELRDTSDIKARAPGGQDEPDPEPGDDDEN